MEKSVDIVKKAIEFKGPCRIPVNFEIGRPELYSTNFPEKYGNDIICVRYDQFDRQISSIERRDEWGCLWRAINSSLGEVKEYPISDWDNYKNMKIPDFNNISRYNNAKLKIDKYRDKYITGGLGFFIFEQMHHLRGLTNLMEDLYLEPDNVENLINILVDLNIGIVRSYENIGCHGVIAWEDWGLQDRLMISPALWRKFFKPAYKKIIEEIHKNNMKFILHSCGYIVDILDDLMEIGVDIFQFDQQDHMGIDFLKNKCGGKVCFYCPVDIQTTMQSDDDKVIVEAVKRMVDAFGSYNGGLIAKTYPQPYDVDISERKMRVMCEAFLRYGSC